MVSLGNQDPRVIQAIEVTLDFPADLEKRGILEDEGRMGSLDKQDQLD